MLLNETVKTSNIPQIIQNESGTFNTSTNTVGVTAANNAPYSSTTTTVTGVPLRTRNYNRDRQQSDDKPENVNIKGKNPPKPIEEFYKDLQQFHEKRGTPIMHMPKITGHEVDLHRLYCEVTERGGFQKVNNRDEWDEILPELGFKEKIVNGSAALKYIYRRILEKYERLNYFGEDPDKVDALEAADMVEFSISGGRGKGSRYPSSYGSSNAAIINSVAMSYNYRQHHVNMDRRRQFKLSTDLHKSSAYEKLMLSLLSPLPNEQDFAINACTLMANESKHTLKLNEYPKLLDALLAHTGVFSDYTMRKLFQHIYSGVRHHSLYGFWYDLLNDKPQILDLYTDEQALKEAALIDDYDDGRPEMEGIWKDCKELDFLNLGTGLGTQDYVGQRVLQVTSILRNLSFQEENLGVLVKNKTFLRFLVMSSNIRWSNIHIQALEIMGNIAKELEIADPTIDDFSRSLMATICDGIEGPDRGVIINCLEILYKLCQKDTNEDFVLKCLNTNFYNTIALFLSLKDIMLLLFTLEAIYALTSLGPKSCHSVMQVKGIIEQLVSLITVEAQSYGPDGFIMMRVVETVPGNMLPMVAQNIANLQNVANIQKQTATNHHQMLAQMKPQTVLPNPLPPSEITETPPDHTQQQPQQIQMPQNFTHDDEQYALAWLGATFERTTNVESHIETQELYRMYLSHCQKFGKHSVVNHLHFPKLVRLIFTSTVGPASVKRPDGTDMPGLHYVSIRLRAQPLPLQKSILSISGQSSVLKPSESPGLARKTKKKVKQQIETTIPPNQAPATSTPPSVISTAIVSENTSVLVDEAIKEDRIPFNPTSQAPIEAIEKSISPQPVQRLVETVCDEKMDVDEKEELPIIEPQSQPAQDTSETLLIADSSQVSQPAVAQNASTSLIKSLLANKVNQRQQKQKDVATAVVSSNSGTGSTNSSTLAVSSTQPIKLPSKAITALVNNPLMQHTPVKVGQTTIKPLNPHPHSFEKKAQISESTPPPLAPLSGANVAKDASGRPIILANQMLVDILDKKLVDPPIPAIIQKRKMEDPMGNNKRLTVESSSTCTKEEVQVTPSKNAANLYAEMAASILEDEDLEEFSTQIQQQPPPVEQQPQTLQQTSLIIPAKVQTQSTASPLQTVQRQIVFQPNQPQLKLTQTAATTSQQLPNAVATIKTDHGLQTVPVILQQKPMEIQQPQTQIIQQMMQPAPQQQQTQYVLATNQQGQTYLVAQQTQPQPPQPPSQPTQTVLVTQTPQQQSTGQKTIIILQQQTLAGQQQQIITTGPPGQGQKMIMTTSQGQQVLVTQRPQTPQQIFINPQTGTATHIQHVPVQTQNRQIIQTSNSQPQQQPQQIQAGQISPSLLNQLNQIPATIKLHQPIVQQPPQSQPPQPATITRMSKTVSLVQSSPPTPTPPVPIPQLQQHQSIIQQHIISGPSEKRHVILSGGGSGGGPVRAIEIKETVITQAQQPPQQCQLNSQTIITTQQPQVAATVKQPAASTLLQTQQQVQQQVQQQIRAVIEQQQHPSIIQQKISSLPVMQQHQQQTQSQIMVQTNVTASKPKISQQQQTPTLLVSKQTDPKQSLAQSKNVNQSQNVVQNIAPSIVSTSNQANSGNIKKTQTLIKPALPAVKLPPVTSTGPPPLTAVNSNTSVTSSITASNSTLTAYTDVSRDANSREDEIKTTSSNLTVSTSQLTNQTISTATEQTGELTVTSSATSNNATNSTTSTTPLMQQSQVHTVTPPLTQQTSVAQPTVQVQQPSAIDAQWLYVCDWRYCPRKEFKSVSDLKHHIYTSHVPDFLDPVSEIFCQWGAGNFLCDKIPRKRYSLMTHIIDRHLTIESLKAAAQRRIETGIHNIAPPKSPVTIVRNIELTQKGNNGSPTPTTSASSNAQNAGTGLSALQAIKRHTADFLNSKELMDENEGPVTKSIRLTASLILRNLVAYTSTAKRSIRRFEPQLANIALSNVESSGTIAHILYEING